MQIQHDTAKRAEWTQKLTDIVGLPLLSEYQRIAQACSLIHDKLITFSGSCTRQNEGSAY